MPAYPQELQDHIQKLNGCTACKAYEWQADLERWFCRTEQEAITYPEGGSRCSAWALNLKAKNLIASALADFEDTGEEAETAEPEPVPEQQPELDMSSSEVARREHGCMQCGNAEIHPGGIDILGNRQDETLICTLDRSTGHYFREAVGKAVHCDNFDWLPPDEEPEKEAEHETFLDPITAMTLPYHPAADAFPLIEGAEFEALCADIRENGLLEPVVIYEMQILDGRNRHRACNALEIECQFQEYLGDDPIGYVLSKNLHRRHLNESQRAMVAARLANLGHGQRADYADAQICASVPQDTAAELLQVSRRTVQSAQKVQSEGAEELQRAVIQGDISVSAAAEIAELPQEEQKTIVEQGPKAVKAAAKQRRESRPPRSRRAPREPQQPPSEVRDTPHVLPQMAVDAVPETELIDLPAEENKDETNRLTLTFALRSILSHSETVRRCLAYSNDPDGLEYWHEMDKTIDDLVDYLGIELE